MFTLSKALHGDRVGLSWHYKLKSVQINTLCSFFLNQICAVTCSGHSNYLKNVSLINRLFTRGGVSISSVYGIRIFFQVDQVLFTQAVD